MDDYNLNKIVWRTAFWGYLEMSEFWDDCPTDKIFCAREKRSRDVGFQGTSWGGNCAWEADIVCGVQLH